MLVQVLANGELIAHRVSHFAQHHKSLWAVCGRGGPKFRVSDGWNKDGSARFPTPGDVLTIEYLRLVCDFEHGLCDWKRLNLDQLRRIEAIALENRCLG